jgi:type II secretory pathway component PulF
LKFLVKSLGFAQEMRSAIFSAMIMPIFLFLFLGGMLAGIAMYGIPAMTELMPADKWTGEGRNLLVMSKFIRSYGLVIVAAIVAGCYFFSSSLTKWDGPQRAKLDQKLPYSFFSAYQGAMLLVSLTALNRGGMSVVASLKQLLDASTPWMAWHLRKIIKNIESSPDKFAEAFNTGMYSDRIIFRMALAASTGNIESKLEEIAAVAMTETIKRIKLSSGFINKIMLAIFGMLLMYIFGTFMLTAQSVGMQAGRNG